MFNHKSEYELHMVLLEKRIGYKANPLRNRWNVQGIESTLWKIEYQVRIQQRNWRWRWSSLLHVSIKRNVEIMGSVAIKQLNILSGEIKKGREMMVHPLLVTIVRGLATIYYWNIFNFQSRILTTKIGVRIRLKYMYARSSFRK